MASPTRKKKPRAAWTYRGVWRNGQRALGWPSAAVVKKRPLAPPRYIALNRSSKWPRAKSYQHAREIGPSAEAVR